MNASKENYVDCIKHVDYDNYISKMLKIQPRQAFSQVNDFCNFEQLMTFDEVLYELEHEESEIKIKIVLLPLKNIIKKYACEMFYNGIPVFSNAYKDDFIKYWIKSGIFVDKHIKWIFNSKEGIKLKSVSWSKSLSCVWLTENISREIEIILCIVDHLYNCPYGYNTLCSINKNNKFVKFYNAGC
jgi:hypothetical protein